MARRDYRLFDSLAPRIMADLLRDVPSWAAEDAAAAVGNAGHECNGFKTLQETKPVVAGSRGGWGWFQWTGPRRRAFEAWAKKQKLDPSSYEANYGFMLVELRGPEKAAVAKTRSAGTLDDKVVAFEKAFERAGVKHYPSRRAYAKRALAAYEAAIHGRRQAPSPPPPAASPVPVLTATEIKAFQQRLRDKGYVMVGEPDGKMGPRTRAAVSAFQTQNDMPVTGELDETTRKKLDNGGFRMPVSAERAQAPAAEIAEKVPEVAAAQKTGFLAKVQGWGAAVAGIVYAAKDYVSDAIESLRPIREAIDSVPAEVYVGGIVVMAGVLWWQSSRTTAAAEEAYRTGART